MADIVELTTFHVGLEHFGDFAQAKDEAISMPFPAWTVIGYTGLMPPGARAEVKATAVVKDR
ncbi:MAG: Rid family hydrolase [Ornithinimicrobium sp.]